MPFSFFFLIDMVRVPSIIKYVVDFAWLCLILMIILNRRNGHSRQTKIFSATVGVFFLLSVFGMALNYQSILYYLWGLRINIRFYVFFFACIFFLKESNVENYLDFFDKIFWINIPVVMIQYLLMGKVQDHLGGIFGVEKGCNAYTNIFMIIVVTRSILRYMNHQEPIKRCLLKCVVALGIAILSELKVFFVELLVVVSLAVLISRFTFRKLWIVLAIAVGTIVAVELLSILFPYFDGWFSLDGIWKIISSSSGYTSSNDMNRISAIPIAWNRFLNTWPKRLLGLGLGNCEHSTFSFLTTPFYHRYRQLHYMWFSSAMLFLEMGLTGLAVYILFFVQVFVCARRVEKNGMSDRVNCQLAQIIAIIAIVQVFYNSSLRMEAGFMVYFVLALPFVSNRSVQVVRNIGLRN